MLAGQELDAAQDDPVTEPQSQQEPPAEQAPA
jgi:hypothetical protein